jgi:hypothetical protein
MFTPLDDAGKVSYALSQDGRLLLRQIIRTRPGPYEGSFLRLPDSVELWESATGERRTQLQLRTQDISALALSPCGTVLASGHEDGSLSLWDARTGKRLAKHRGHEARVLSLTFSASGRLLVSGSDDTSALVCDVSRLIRLAGLPRGAAQPLRELERCWDMLGSKDPPVAYRAMIVLARTPKQMVQLFQSKLRPVPPASAEKIKQLIGQLAAKHLADRQSAENQLLALGQVATPQLRQALKDRPDKKSTSRIKRLLSVAAGSATVEEQLRLVRAVEVLERAATAPARGLLVKLARGAAQAPLTEEAGAALGRLRFR